MADRTSDDEAPSLLLLLVDALAFWLRHQAVFWLIALPTAGLGAAITYVLDSDRQFIDWRDHWGWGFLFALIYAMFLDRWIKEVLLEDAIPCDEVDELRRSTIALRFLLFAAALCLMATVLALLPQVALDAVLWTAAASLFVLTLPSLSAAEPLSLRKAFALGRPLQIPLFLLIGGTVAVSLLAGVGLAWGSAYLPDNPWKPAAIAAVHRLIDCLLLAVVGYALAAVFRQLTGWQQPASDDHPYWDLRLPTRKG